MANRVLRIGIAGQGRSGWDIHALISKQFQETFRVVAVADQLADRRARAQRELQCRAYRDYKDLIKDKEVDIFVNALPSFLHPKGTIEALRGGKHVICEKPSAVKVSDFDRMVQAARKAGKIYAPFQNNRFAPHFVKARQLIASRIFGRIVHCRISSGGFSRRWDWQTRQDYWGGTLNNTCPHYLDQMIVLFGDGMPNAFCRLITTKGSFGDAENVAMVTLFGKDKPVIEMLVTSNLAYPAGDLLSINGDYGGVTGNHSTLTWRYFDPKEAPKRRLDRGWSSGRYEREDLPWVERTWNATDESWAKVSPTYRAYENFRNVFHGKAELVVTHDQVRRQVAVIEECHRQSPLPKWVGKYAQK